MLSRDPGWGNYGPIAATAMVYIPASQTSPAFLRLIHTWFSPVFVVRSARGVQGLEPLVRSALAGVDPPRPVARFESLALWGVAPRDPLAFSASAAFLLAVAAIASLIPALRPLRLDPAITLRAE